MKIRLTGTRAEIDAMLPALSDALDVLEVSDFYPNRGNSQLGRVYIEVGGVRARTVRADAVRTDRAPGAIEPRRRGEIRGDDR